MNKPILIGIAGGSASGKTSVSQRIKDTFSNEKSVLIMRQDDYYKDQAHMTMEERVNVNYDHPFAFDFRTQEVFVGIDVCRIVGHSAAYAYGVYAFLYLGNVAANVVSGAFVPRWDGVCAIKFVESLGVEQ